MRSAAELSASNGESVAVAGLVPAEFFGEFARTRVAIDDEEFGVNHLGEVHQLVGADCCGEHDVVCGPPAVSQHSADVAKSG